MLFSHICLRATHVADSPRRNRKSCKVLNSNRSWKTMQLRLHVTLKTRSLCCFWREHWHDRERGFLCHAVLFFCSNQKRLRTFWFFCGPNQHAAALVLDCRGVNCSFLVWRCTHFTISYNVFLFVAFRSENVRHHTVYLHELIIFFLCLNLIPVFVQLSVVSVRKLHMLRNIAYVWWCSCIFIDFEMLESKIFGVIKMIILI